MSEVSTIEDAMRCITKLQAELAEARAQIALLGKGIRTWIDAGVELNKLITAKDAALQEVREHLFDIAHSPYSPIISMIDDALAAPAQEKSNEP